MKRLISRARTRRNAESERGVVMLELALALPLMLIVALGLVEGGMAYRSVTQTNSAVRAGARVASHDGAQPTADFDALQAIEAALPSELRSNVVRVVVYKASSANDVVPAACLSTPTSSTGSGVNNVCNIYNAYQLQNGSLGNFGTTSSCSGKWDADWCPRNRNVDGSSTFPGNIDYIGVYIETKHPSITNSFFDDYTIKRRVVFRLEPEVER